MQLPGKGLIFLGLIGGLSKAFDISPMIAHLLVWVACGALLFWLDPFPQSEQMRQLTDADRAYAMVYCLNGVPHPAPVLKADDQAYLKRLCASADR